MWIWFVTLDTSLKVLQGFDAGMGSGQVDLSLVCQNVLEILAICQKFLVHLVENM